MNEIFCFIFDSLGRFIRQNCSASSLLPEINDCFINILRIDFSVALDFHWQIFMAAPMKLAWEHFFLPQSTHKGKKKEQLSIPDKIFIRVRWRCWLWDENKYILVFIVFIECVCIFYIGCPMPTYTISHFLNFRSSLISLYTNIIDSRNVEHSQAKKAKKKIINMKRFSRITKNSIRN